MWKRRRNFRRRILIEEEEVGEQEEKGEDRDVHESEKKMMAVKGKVKLNEVNKKKKKTIRKMG